jgi:PIN domain nuclease of toxin-antitoxin system
VLDPSTRFEVVPIEAAMMTEFERVPLEDLGDPYDRFILATAAHMRLSLVAKDRAITSSGVVDVIW